MGGGVGGVVWLGVGGGVGVGAGVGGGGRGTLNPISDWNIKGGRGRVNPGG